MEVLHILWRFIDVQFDCVVIDVLSNAVCAYLCFLCAAAHN